MEDERSGKRLKLSNEQLESMPVDLLLDIAKRLSLKDFVELSQTSKTLNEKLYTAKNTIFRHYLKRDFGMINLPYDLDAKTAYYMLVKPPITQLKIGVWFRSDAHRSVGHEIGPPDIIITTVNQIAPYHEAVRRAADAIPHALQLTTNWQDNDRYEIGDQAFPGYVRILMSLEEEKQMVTAYEPHAVHKFVYYKYIASPPPRGVKITVDHDVRRFEDGVWKINVYR